MSEIKCNYEMLPTHSGQFKHLDQVVRNEKQKIKALGAESLSFT